MSNTFSLARAQPNQHGARDAAVYHFRGDATAAPVTEIISADGVPLPARRLPLAHPVQIKLLHFNDLHGHICRFSGEEGTQPVFSRFAAGLRAARDRADGVVVLAVTSGDDCGGAVFDELLGCDAASFRLHAGYRLYSAAGIDVGVIGNHDLDRGDVVLAEAIRRDAQFPVLAANIAGSPALAQTSVPAVLYIIDGLRIGFIGLVTPAQRYPEPGCAWHITDPVQTAGNLIPAMRPVCDVLVILSHLGRSLSDRGAHLQVAGDMELAQRLPPGSVNLIVGGHTHNALNADGLSTHNIVNGIPIVQAGSSGDYLGEVEITAGETVTVTRARLLTASRLPADAVFERDHVQPLVDRVRPYRAQSLGRVADDERLSTTAVRNGFAAGESALANFIADALVVQARTRGYPVDLAMVDRSVVSCGLPTGARLTFGVWFDAMPYADVLGLCRLTGHDLRALVQDNARRIDRPDEPHCERGFLHFSSAVRYEMDASADRRQARAAGICVNSIPIEAGLDRTYLVAAPSFIRGLAAEWEADTAATGSLPLFDLRRLPWEYTPLRVRDLLVAHILAHGGVLPEGGARLDGRLVNPAAK